MQNRTALLAKTQLQQFSNIRENIHRFDKKLNQTNWQFYMFMEEIERTYWWTYSAINNHHLAIKMLARYFSFHMTNMCKYIDFYRQYAVTLDTFLTALDTLAEGVLSTPIIDPITLHRVGVPKLKWFLEFFILSLFMVSWINF